MPPSAWLVIEKSKVKNLSWLSGLPWSIIAWRNLLVETWILCGSSGLSAERERRIVGLTVENHSTWTSFLPSNKGCLQWESMQIKPFVAVLRNKIFISEWRLHWISPRSNSISLWVWSLDRLISKMPLRENPLSFYDQQPSVSVQHLISSPFISSTLLYYECPYLYCKTSSSASTWLFSFCNDIF